MHIVAETMFSSLCSRIQTNAINKAILRKVMSLIIYAQLGHRDIYSLKHEYTQQYCTIIPDK